MINPFAILFWLFGAAIGFLFSQTLFGTVMGAVVCFLISLLASLLVPARRF